MWMQEWLAGCCPTQPKEEQVPIEERCWKCNYRRAGADSPAGICQECHDELVKAQAA